MVHWKVKRLVMTEKKPKTHGVLFKKGTTLYIYIYVDVCMHIYINKLNMNN